MAGWAANATNASWDSDDFDVPLALMTFGWDPAGDPTHHWRGSGRDVNCAKRILDLPRVVAWFASHTQGDSYDHPKVGCANGLKLGWQKEVFVFNVSKFCVREEIFFLLLAG